MGSSRNNRNEKNPLSDRDLKQSDKGEYSQCLQDTDETTRVWRILKVSKILTKKTN